MLRALVVSFAIFAASFSLPAAAIIPSPVGETNTHSDNTHSDTNAETNREIDNEQPSPQSNLDAGSSPGSSSGSDEDSAAEKEILEAANKSRKQAGLPPLQLAESLQEAARAHARRMVSSKRLEHQLPGESDLLERIGLVISQHSGSQDSALKIDRAGENIADATSAHSAHESLMHSPLHRKNLLDSGFDVAGVAAIWSGGRLIVVQDFAHEVASYSAQQNRKLVGRAVDETRQQAGLGQLVQLSPPHLDEAACSLARENRPNAHLLAAAFGNRRVIAYTQSRPEVLPPGALRLLRDPAVQQFAVGSCYARNAAYPTGMYWVAILLY
jgi:uncharacterized protein YkwD